MVTVNPLYANINKTFIKNAYFFQNKTIYRKCHCCTFLQISLIFGFMESSVLVSASMFNLLQSDAFIEVYEENSASHRDVVGGGRNIWWPFSENFGYSSLILFENPMSGISLKINCGMKSETMSMNFSYSVTLKSFSLSWNLSGSFIHALFCNRIYQ